MSEDLLTQAASRLGVPVVGDWVEITQAMIDKFADATGDHQYIHVDPEAARQTPFGGTIAHGFLTLSLLALLASTAPGVLPTDQVRTGVNYGANKLRFLAPVRSGAKVRGRFTLLELVEKQPGQYQQTMEFVVEIQGQDKPALAAEWIVQLWL